MRKIIILLASAALLSTAACNTMRGAGEDVKDAADAADRAV
ncbi:MAG TPA: entericidin EcnA/B family protein [Caulobacteraceae bacterium]|jgi:predicted small secreted protein